MSENQIKGLDMVFNHGTEVRQFVEKELAVGLDALGKSMKLKITTTLRADSLSIEIEPMKESKP